jgi:hypothetical protein
MNIIKKIDEYLQEGGMYGKDPLSAVKIGKVSKLSNDDLFDAATQLDQTKWEKAVKADVMKWSAAVVKELKTRGFDGSLKPTFK